MSKFQVKCVSCKTVAEFKYDDEFTEIECMNCGYIFTEGREALLEAQRELNKDEIADHFTKKASDLAKKIIK